MLAADGTLAARPRPRACHVRAGGGRHRAGSVSGASVSAAPGRRLGQRPATIELLGLRPATWRLGLVRAPPLIAGIA